MSRERRVVGALVVAVLAFIALTGTMPPASAHVTFVGSDPSDGARLRTVPSRIVLQFSEELSPPAAVVLTGPEGSSAEAGKTRIDGRRVLVDVDLADGASGEGTYGVTFRVVSVDGHPVSGQVTFVVGDGPLEESPGDSGAAEVEADTPSDPAAADPRGQARPAESDAPISWGQIQVGVPIVLFSLAALLAFLGRRQGT